MSWGIEFKTTVFLVRRDYKTLEEAIQRKEWLIEKLQSNHIDIAILTSNATILNVETEEDTLINKINQLNYTLSDLLEYRENLINELTLLNLYINYLKNEKDTN